MKNTYESSGPVGKEKNRRASNKRRETGLASRLLESSIRQEALYYACRLTGNAQDAEDLVQEALFRTAREWRRFDASRPLRPWVLTVLRNAFLDARKCSGARAVVSLDGLLSEGRPVDLKHFLPLSDAPVDEAIERGETSLAVRSALGRMGSPARRVLILRHLKGLKFREIAKVLGMPEGTVRSRVFRAQESFRKQFSSLKALA